MNRAILLMIVGRPKTGVGDVRQRCPGTVRGLRQRIHGYGAVGRTKEIRSGVVKDRALLQVIGPIGYDHLKAARSVCFDRILIDGGVDQAQIVQDFGCLRAFAGTEESGHCNCRQQGDNRDYDHDFHEGEAPAAFVEFV